MKSFIKQDRIKSFSNLMNDYISDEFKNWLIKNKFFDAPASINYHGAYTGGLFEHSFAVTKTLLSFTRRLDLKWQNERSPYIVGMFHDLCKIDDYILTKKRLGKNALGDVIEEKWEYNNKITLTGHGDKSIFLLQKYVPLTEEEMLCVRWHMGAFDDKENWNYYNKAIEKYPNVLYTHTADMVAAKVLEV